MHKTAEVGLNSGVRSWGRSGRLVFTQTGWAVLPEACFLARFVYEVLLGQIIGHISLGLAVSTEQVDYGDCRKAT